MYAIDKGFPQCRMYDVCIENECNARQSVVYFCCGMQRPMIHILLTSSMILVTHIWVLWVWCVWAGLATHTTARVGQYFTTHGMEGGHQGPCLFIIISAMKQMYVTVVYLLLLP